MTHSKRTQAKKEAIKRDLEKRVKELQKLKEKHFKDAYEITLPNVSLGDLRAKWTLQQKPLHPAVERRVPHFTRMPSDPDRPLVIRGSDGGLLACRIRLNRPDLIQKLSDSIEQLPADLKHYKYKGITRGEYQTRHLGVWAPYMKTPEYTAEHRDKQEAHDKFLEDNKELFRDMSGLMGMLVPGVFKEFQRYPLGPEQERGAGAWAALVVNNGGNNPNQTNIHRDVREAQFGYSCGASCGDFRDGAIILYDLG